MNLNCDQVEKILQTSFSKVKCDHLKVTCVVRPKMMLLHTDVKILVAVGVENAMQK